ncbi:MAG TPA: ABC transporter ATP-binding protein [Firmicutes bacterium]|jgi:peptide/nickel transport system ATP-binding protein|nr:ABC transporter ATP-binding protein [Bacillota bacterium]
MKGQLILEVKGLKKHFPITSGKQKGKAVKAIDGIDFFIREGETLGLVGESGSGKSTTAYCVIGMYSVTAGEMTFKGQDISTDTRKRPLSIKKDIGMVFQDPGTTLNPQRSVKQILSLPLSVHGMLDKKDPEGQLLQLLEDVELPGEYLFSYPASLGGGERQMLAIARALATDPSMIVLDEPTSSLDVSVQAKIINMLLRLQKRRNLAYLFITHDLSLMRNLATRIAIMYLGKIAEIAPTETFFSAPRHPYTQMLLSAIPVISEAEEELKPKRVVSRGEIPSPVDVPPGCSFNTRCPFVTDRCFEDDPQMREIESDHWVRCHLL